MKEGNSRAFRFDPYLLEPGEHRLTRNGEEIRLRPKTFEVLTTLVIRHGHLLSKEQLLESVWPDTFVTEKSLRQSIVEIRDALNDHGAVHRYIETVPKVGYQVVGSVVEMPSSVGSSVVRLPGTWVWKAAFVLPVLALVLVVLDPGEETPRGSVTRFSLAIPEDARFDIPPMYPLAISPDGRLLVYRATDGNRARLLLRRFDRLEAVELAGTESADAPFFSPDGRWVGFLKGPVLYKVMVGGGLPVTICVVEEWDRTSESSFRSAGETGSSINSGGHWGRDGTIVFSMYSESGIWRVSAEGGRAMKISEKGRWPQLLPGGKHVLCSLLSEGRYQTAVLSVETGESHILDAGEAGARYVPTGHLLYGSSGTIYAVRFDPARLRVIGSPSAVVERVGMHPYQLAYFAVSENGTLAYLPGHRRSAIMIVDRGGEVRELVRESCGYQYPRFSPDGRRIAVTKLAEGTHFDIWVYDLDHGNRVQLTNEDINTYPVWTPDGRGIIFAVRGKGIYICPSDGSQQKELLLEQGDSPMLRPTSISPDGKTLLYHTRGKDSRRDVWAYQLGGNAEPILNSKHDENHARFSPDGRWIIYVSNDSGQEELYLKPFPIKGGRWMVSANGGNTPAWSPRGDEIFYRDLPGGRILSSTFRGSPVVEIRAPQPLLGRPARHFDVSPDGRQFVVVESVSPRVINVVINWFTELERLAP